MADGILQQQKNNAAAGNIYIRNSVVFYNQKGLLHIMFDYTI